MRAIRSLAFLAYLSTVSAFSGRHAAHHGLLQIPPSFAHDDIHMYPALHPEHDPNNLRHLIPEDSKELYYSQEGHRPALHGAKHGRLHATFSRPTVVLDHSSHIEDVNCGNGNIEICFAPEAFATVETEWKKYENESFNLITYHVGCGHLTGEYRSFFIASQPTFEGNCVTVLAELTDEQEEIQEAKLNWGTYQRPDIAKRQRVLGHVKVAKADPQMQMRNLMASDRLNGTGNITSGGMSDLTKDAAAVKNFFGTDSINTDIPDEYEIGLDYLSDSEYDQFVKRGLFSWIVEGINAIIKAVVNLIEKTRQAIETAVKIIVAIAEVSLKLLMVPFGVPFEQGYHADINFDHRTGGGKLATDLGSALGGTETGFALSKPGAAVQMECESCGAKANFSFGGELAFSISKGIYRAEVSFINHEDFVFDAIYGITVDAKAFKAGSAKGGFKTTIEKELFALPFYAIKIPKIITIGPQAVINTAASVYVDAHGEFRAGARFSIESGEVILDAMEPQRNKASGFTPHIEPIFELKKGNVVATADLALPVGVEVALDILGGTWKKSVGVYTAPSIYFTAGVSSGEGHACNNGVELRAGAKNRIYSSALGIWEYEFKELGITFYETARKRVNNLYRAKGWNATQVEPTSTLFNNVAATFGGQENLASNTTFNLTKPGPIIYEDEHFQSKSSKDDKDKLRKLPKTNGFRLIQDAGQTSTLVSGKDGRIYMVNNSAEYDISAPWGGLEVDKNIFSYDVFGRLIWFDAEHLSEPILGWYRMVELGVSAAEHMPRRAKAATFSVMKSDGIETYGVSFNHPESVSESEKEFWFPTVCKGKDGLRLFATPYLVDKDGIAHSRKDPDKKINILQLAYHADRKHYKVDGARDTKSNKFGDTKACITVRLTSDRKSTVAVS
ncbi:hypothetical protein P875_00127970 [Aspergillus parasiticus SU-1]|uniref:Uncharacterized protein n=1 Tax=Aspergillus parasiticus (strain ATCC 56775 / NRRL 5862 / SRRC 143 / SU-1) TaxID=1403190 RepID=A0A0F0IFW3_ASPPU|nr:hypothetical protein P875_00127970 [Aspergillus parasiticus SU-1]